MRRTDSRPWVITSIRFPSITEKWAGRLKITAENSYGRARLYFSPFDDHISPNWSPSGKEMLLISNRGIPLGSGRDMAHYRGTERDGNRKNDSAGGDALPHAASVVAGR